MDKTKVKIGLLDLGFCPISTEPDDSVPTYAAAAKELSLGHAVKASLSVETDELAVYGDDALQISAEFFKKGKLDTEALLDDIALEGALFGATVDNDGGVTDSDTDVAPYGAVYYTQKLMKKDRSIVYRAVVLFKAQATIAGTTDEANTKGERLEPKNHPLGFNISACNSGDWRWRKEYTTRALALSGIAGVLHPSASS